MSEPIMNIAVKSKIMTKRKQKNTESCIHSDCFKGPAHNTQGSR